MTPSKVTINVRDPSLAGSPSKLPPSELATTIESDATDHGDGAVASNANAPSPSLSATLNPSSPSSPGSLRIEVAEPEFMDDSSGPTVWMPATANGVPGSDPYSREALFRTFPYVGTEMDADVLNRLYNDLNDPDLFNLDTLAQLADWLRSYLRATQDIPTQWLDLYLSDRDFWDSLPKVVNTILLRKYVAFHGPAPSSRARANLS